jgi:L-fuculose-phosphate aldolase
MSDGELRSAMIDAGRQMNAGGLNQGTAGNISARAGEGLLVTPSGVSYDLMGESDIIFMQWDGDWAAPGSDCRPSSEWRFHRDILQERPDVGAVLHAHAPFSTALACLGKDIPAFHYMVAVAGGTLIKCSEYATFGTAELSHAALAALDKRNACLLANHGMIACADNPAAALALAIEVEALAAQYMRALGVGEPRLLDDAEMQRVLEKFAAGYGYASEPGSGPEGEPDDG